MCIQEHAAGGLGYATEATQFAQAQVGCRDCLNTLMFRHAGLVPAVVRQQVLGTLPFAQAVQAGRIGLWRAILGFDPSLGWAFSTYAWTCIMRHVWREVKSHERCRSVSEADGKLPARESPSPAEEWEATAVQQALGELVQRLPWRLRHIIVRRYGLDGHPPATYRQIGVVLGVCGERARQLHTEALVWLRHPAHSQLLRSLLDRHTTSEYETADALAQRWLRQRGGRHG
jgi:RNA polymerase sigma factor (sigma-70 family)